MQHIASIAVSNDFNKKCFIVLYELKNDTYYIEEVKNDVLSFFKEQASLETSVLTFFKDKG